MTPTTNHRMYVGDAYEVLSVLPPKSVHCIVTSPPYWGQRDYTLCKCRKRILAKDQPSSALMGSGAGTPSRLNLPDLACIVCKGTGQRAGMDTEIGREGDPDSYVIALTEVFDAAYQVLRDDGTLWLNLGDKWHNGQMMGLPWRVAFALKAYGWILRADCIWAKKNVMPSSVQNRCTYSHEHMFMFTKKPAGYFYDSVAIQEPMISGAGTKNKRDVWLLATQPVSEPHYATFPTWLVEPCILAGTSEKGCCMNCGAPLIREFTTAKITRDRPNATTTRHMQDAKVNSCENTVAGTAVTTAGWKPSCQCIGTDTRPCTVLDLFGGSGTVSIVAETHKRSSVLIDLDEANAGIASRRLKAKTNYELEIIS